ncbi:MAG TPA: TIGR00645 family protein [Malonomonas sp.]
MKIIEQLIFKSRWLLAPFFIGLILALVVLLGNFIKELFYLNYNFFELTKSESIVSILSLLDITLIACLVIVIIFSGYDIFVSKFSLIEDNEKPTWMGKIYFSDLKLKLITAIVAISSVELLREIINVDNIENSSNETMAWKIGFHLTFVLTGVLFALTELIVSKKGQGH